MGSDDILLGQWCDLVSPNSFSSRCWILKWRVPIHLVNLLTIRLPHAPEAVAQRTALGHDDPLAAGNTDGASKRRAKLVGLHRLVCRRIQNIDRRLVGLHLLLLASLLIMMLAILVEHKIFDEGACAP